MSITTKDITTLFPHNHASNLISLDNGDILCAWFAGSREGRADICILCSRLKNGEKQWSQPKIISNDKKRSEQNPLLFKNPNGELWLLYTAQDEIYQDSAIVKVKKSRDNGYTWSEEELLFDTPGSFIRNPPIIFDDGEIVLPAYYCKKSDAGFLSNDYSVVKISSDNGLTWAEKEVPQSTGLVHMCIVKLSERKLVGFFRSRRADYIYSTYSEDRGNTWSNPVATTLPNNNASIQAIKLKDGTLMMVFNNVNAITNPPKENRPPWFSKEDMERVNRNNSEDQQSIWGVIRTPLAIAISEDQGRSWIMKKNLIDNEKQINIKERPEFSYPSIIQTDDELIHISFTYLRKNIRHVTISKDWVEKNFTKK